MRRRSAILFVLGCAIAPAALAQWTPDAAPEPHFGDDPTKTAPSSDGSEAEAAADGGCAYLDLESAQAARTVRVTKRELKQPKTLTHRADVELGAVNMED